MSLQRRRYRPRAHVPRGEFLPVVILPSVRSPRRSSGTSSGVAWSDQGGGPLALKLLRDGLLRRRRDNKSVAASRRLGRSRKQTQALAYVYFEEEPGPARGGQAVNPRRGPAHRRQAKLPDLLRRTPRPDVDGNLRLQLSSLFQARGETSPGKNLGLRCRLTRGLPPGRTNESAPTTGRSQIGSGQTFRQRPWSAGPPGPCWSSRSGSPEASSPLGSRARGRCAGARSLGSHP